MTFKSLLPLTLAASAVLCGCSSGTASNTPSGHTVFIDVSTESSAPQVLGYQFPAGGTPSTTPVFQTTGTTGTFLVSSGVDASGNVYTLLDTPDGVSGNTTGNDLFSVNVYPTGSTTVSRSFTLNSTQSIDRFTVDPVGNVYLLTDDNSGNYTLSTYGSSATGSSPAPSKTVTNASFSNFDNNIVVDASGNLFMIYFDQTAGQDDIAVYPAGFTSSTTPTLLTSSAQPDSNLDVVAVDAHGKVYGLGTINDATALIVFTPTNGVYNITQTITGSNVTIEHFGAIAADANGDIFVRTTGNNQPVARPGQVSHALTQHAQGGVVPHRSGAGNVIMEFAAGANGNVGPAITLNTSSSNDSESDDIAVF